MMALAKHYGTWISINQSRRAVLISYSNIPCRICDSLDDGNMAAEGMSDSINLRKPLSECRDCEKTSEITLTVTEGDKAKSSCQCNSGSKTRAL